MEGCRSVRMMSSSEGGGAEEAIWIQAEPGKFCGESMGERGYAQDMGKRVAVFELRSPTENCRLHRDY